MRQECLNKQTQRDFTEQTFTNRRYISENFKNLLSSEDLKCKKKTKKPEKHVHKSKNNDAHV